MKRTIITLFIIVHSILGNAQNVGIGTVNPTSKFHLVGDYFQEGGVLNINDASAKIQLLNGGVNKASMYLWSDNLRIGTNASNTAGDVHIQTVGSIRLSLLAVNGNVGIGTLSPLEKMHVNGNILSSNRIDANGVIEGAGISSLGTLYVNSTSLLQGAVTGNASATFNSTITSNTSMVVNDPAGIVQLQNAGVNKGFIQLSGDNLRLGTNNGNATGNLVVRMNGNDRITINPNGDLNTAGKITAATTGNSNLLPICYGRVVTATATLGVYGTNNITVTKVQTGIYDITCTSFGNLTVIVGSVTSLRSNVEHVFNSRYMGFGTNTYRVRLTPLSGGAADEDFSFVAYNHTL